GRGGPPGSDRSRRRRGRRLAAAVVLDSVDGSADGALTEAADATHEDANVMPHYLVETTTTSRTDLLGTVRLAAERYPEIAIEDRFIAHDGPAREVWVCRAPSRFHLHRWAAASGLVLRSLEQFNSTPIPDRWWRTDRPASSTEEGDRW